MRKGFLIYEEMRKYFPIYEDGGRQSYMTLQLLHSEFPYIWGKFNFLFCQCRAVTEQNWYWTTPLAFLFNRRLFLLLPKQSTHRTAEVFFFVGSEMYMMYNVDWRELTPLINIQSRISPRIFEKIRNGRNGILRSRGETDSRKKLEADNLMSDSLEHCGHLLFCWDWDDNILLTVLVHRNKMVFFKFAYCNLGS